MTLASLSALRLGAIHKVSSVVQSMTLSMNSWGITRDILSEVESQGGISLVGLGPYALCMHSQTFVKYVQGAPATTTLRSATTPRSARSFERWAEGVGLLLEERMLPYMRLAHRCRRPAGGLGSVCMAYMRLRKHSAVMLAPPVGKEELLGLWHNARFVGARGRTVAPTMAIKRGFLRWRDGAYDDYLKALKSAHLQQFANGLATVLSVQSGLSQWRGDLGCWLEKWFSQCMLLASSRRVISRPAGMRGSEWRAFSHLRVPGFDYDFVRKALWLNLPVAERLVAVSKSSVWAFDGQTESCAQFFEQCQFA